MRVFWLILMAASAVSVSINGVLGHSVSNAWSYGIRSIELALFLFASFKYVTGWSIKHDKAFPQAEDPQPNAFGYPLSDLEIRRVLDQFAVTHRLSVADLQSLTRQITQPQLFRFRTSESILLERRQIVHRVQTLFELNSFPIAPQVLVCFSRPKKAKVYENARFGTETGGAFTPVPYIDSVAICYRVCSMWVRQLNGGAMTSGLRNALAGLVANPAYAPDRVNEICKAVTGHDYTPVGAAPLEIVVHDILDTLSLRRPMFMYFDTTSGRPHSEYSYTRGYGERVVKVKPEDWWTRLKTLIRERVGLSPTQIPISVGRGRSAKRFNLQVAVPEGMYIAETACWDELSNVMIPRLDHGSVNRQYIGWREPRGQSATSVATRDLADTPFIAPRALVRLEERPPGTLATATVTAFASAFCIWICGALFPGGNTTGPDLVAFLLIAPGLVAVGFGLSLGDSANRLRSLFGVLCLVISAVASVSGIALYLAHGSDVIGLHDWPGKITFFFVQDIGWSVLLFVALANSIVASLALGTRLTRYRRALRTI